MWLTWWEQKIRIWLGVSGGLVVVGCFQIPCTAGGHCGGFQKHLSASCCVSVRCHQARSSQFEVGGRRFPGVLKTQSVHKGTAVLGAPAPWGLLVPGGLGAGRLSHWQHWTTCSLGAGTEAETSWKQQVITAEVTGEEKGGCGGPLWSHVRVVRGCQQARGAPTDPGRELSTGRRSCRQLLLYSTTGTPNSKMGFKTCEHLQHP